MWLQGDKKSNVNGEMKINACWSQKMPANKSMSICVTNKIILNKGGTNFKIESDL